MTYIEQNPAIVNVEQTHINMQVFNLLEDLEAVGNLTTPRGFKCKGANLATLDIDPLYPIMNFKPRSFNWRYFAGELSWYLQKTPSIDFINNFSSFWKDICPQGVCNSNYGHILLGPHPSTMYQEYFEGVNQMEWVYNSLVKDKDSRQAVAFLSCPHYQRNDGTKDFVCTLYVNFFITKNCLDMKVQMRSNDIFFGLTYDAPWFSTLHQTMYLNLKKVYPELQLGMYYHCADNIHFYERHFELVEKILDSPLDSSISLRLKTPLFEFEDGTLFLSKSSNEYMMKVNEIVKTGNITKDQMFWKEFLQHLYEIG